MDFAELSALAGGHAEARAIQTAIKLGIFESLKDRGLYADSLAGAIGANPRATALIGNALVALGLLEFTDDLYQLNETSRRYLIESSSEYLGGLILFDAAIFEHWVHLEQTIRTGKPARIPDMFQNRADETERFIRAMDGLTRARGDAEYVAKALDLSRVSTIADVGGGPGTYLAAMLARWPHLHARLYDLPATLGVAHRILIEKEPQLAPRIELVQVNYLKQDLPGGCGALFMSNIIHSEDEATNAELMRKCFRALEPRGLLVIKDHVMNSELTEPRAGAIFSLYLLLTTRGRDYSFAEIGGWLHDAGFVDVRLEALPSPRFTSSMVLARKP
jgi:hypothetical protein